MNLGSAFVALKEYERAKEAFDRAQELGLPPRLLRYRFEIYLCLFELQDYEGLLTLTQSMIDQGARVEEIHLYRAQAYVALNNATQARAEYERALEIHPDWKPAEDGLTALSQ
jgi:tetratricopeptide (TPR) repeat protein